MNETTAKNSATSVPQKSPQETKKASPAPTPTANQKVAKQGTNLSAIFAFLLALVAVALSVYLYQQQENIKKSQSQLQQQLRSIPQQRAADLAKLGSDPRIETLQKKVQQLTSVQQQNVIQLDQKLQDIHTSLRNRINQVGHNRTQEIVLTEVEFLLRIAQHQFNLLHHRNDAANTLLTAQQRLQTLASNNQLNLLINLLHQTIQKLNRINTPNIEQMAIQLAQLEKQINSLSPLLNQVEHKTPQTNSSESNGIWKTLEKLVVVRQNGRVIQPFSNKDQQQKTEGELLLKLGAARIALFRYEEKAYKNHINASLEFIKNHYNINTEQGRYYLINLNKLLNITLSVEEINLQPSLDLIQTIRKQHVNTSTPPPTESKGKRS